MTRSRSERVVGSSCFFFRGLVGEVREGMEDGNGRTSTGLDDRERPRDQ